MSFTNYSRTSIYAQTPQTSWYLDIARLPKIPALSTDQKIVINSRWEKRPDLLSYDLYETPDYWWVFAIRNPNQIEDPIHDLTIGLEIFAPTKQQLEGLING